MTITLFYSRLSIFIGFFNITVAYRAPASDSDSDHGPSTPTPHSEVLLRQKAIGYDDVRRLWATERQTAQSRAYSIPPEVWVSIFGYVHAVNGSSALLPLLLVCKYWKDCCLPVLYENVSLSAERQLSILLGEQTPSRSRRAGDLVPHHFIRALEVHSNNSRHISSLLKRVSNLRLFRLGKQITHHELNLLVHHSYDTLTTLDIVLDSGLTTLGTRGLNAFRNLKRLTLTVNGNCMGPHITRLSLRSIEHLTWTHKNNNEDHVRYFSECYFPRLSSLHLTFSALTTQWIDEHLKYFFIGRHRSFDTFFLHIPSGCLPHFFATCNISVRRGGVAMQACTGGQKIIASLPLYIQHLTLFIKPNHVLLFSYLGEVESSRDSGGISHVRIVLDGCRFTWDSAKLSDEYALFVGRLVPWVMRLQSRGVTLTDEGDRIMFPVAQARPIDFPRIT